MKINIADAISKYVKLNKLGRGYAGICPFCGAKGNLSLGIRCLIRTSVIRNV